MLFPKKIKKNKRILNTDLPSPSPSERLVGWIFQSVQWNKFSESSKVIPVLTEDRTAHLTCRVPMHHRDVQVQEKASDGSSGHAPTTSLNAYHYFVVWELEIEVSGSQAWNALFWILMDTSKVVWKSGKHHKS